MKRLKQSWDKKKATLNGWLSLNNTFSAEVFSKAGFESLTIDMQHGISDYNSLISLLQAINNLPVFVRVPWLEAGVIMKTLDAGANAIICPMINNKKQALKLAQYTLYPPLGARSFGPIRAKFLFEDYFQKANEEIFTFAMIETKEAIENLEEILSVQGINGIYIGPADLSASLGLNPQFDQENEQFLQKLAYIVKTAKSHKKYLGIHNLSFEYAKKMQKMGFDFLTLGSDLHFMLDGAKKAIKSFHQEK